MKKPGELMHEIFRDKINEMIFVKDANTEDLAKAIDLSKIQFQEFLVGMRVISAPQFFHVCELLDIDIRKLHKKIKKREAERAKNQIQEGHGSFNESFSFNGLNRKFRD